LREVVTAFDEASITLKELDARLVTTKYSSNVSTLSFLHCDITAIVNRQIKANGKFFFIKEFFDVKIYKWLSWEMERLHSRGIDTAVTYSKKK
jgi:hypothetical protein